jgi:3-deoxy-manno-octulosonate cytidylyltransferase (CMP-KDO synthetase)
VLGVIPARYGSTRFPGKLLAVLGGKALLLHVWDRAREAGSLARLVVATDDERIGNVVRAAGGEVRLTPSGVASGSDRVALVARELEREGESFEVVVNLQGDEPFLPGQAIDRAVSLLEEDAAAAVATLAVPVAREEAERPDVVKVVVDGRRRALYFSRARIPYPREGDASPLKHVGIYAFRRSYLERFIALPPSPLELAEGLEQLRILEDGAGIRVGVGDWEVLGVDTPEDLVRAEAHLARLVPGVE